MRRGQSVRRGVIALDIPRPTAAWGRIGLAMALGLLLLAVLGNAGSLLDLVHLNSDLAAPLVMGDVAHRYADAQLVTGRLGWWGGLWVVQLLRPLPGGLWVANWLPLGATLAVAGLVAWQARRVWSEVSALVVALVALAVGYGAWISDASWSARGPSWCAMGLVGLAVVRASGRPGRPDAGTLALGLAAVVAVAVTGSGDQLAVVGGAAPLVASGVVALILRRRGLGLVLVAGAGVVYGLAALIASLAEASGYLRQDTAVHLIDLDKLGDAFHGLVRGARDVWRGPPDVGTVAGDVAVGVVAVAVLAGLVTLVRSVARRGTDAQRGVWTAFWLTALLGYLLAYLVTDVGGLAWPESTRYLYGVPLAAGATLAPLGASRLGRWVAGVGAAALATLAAISFLANPPQVPPIQSDLSRSTLFPKIEQVARSEHVVRGFASYWTAYPLVLHSDRKLDVTPAGTCTIDGEIQLCAMYLHYVDQAYAVQPVARSFVLVDESGLSRGGFSPGWVQSLPKSVHPIKIIEIGDGIRMAIVGHDVAADLHPNGGQNDPRIGRGGPLEPTG